MRAWLAFFGLGSALGASGAPVSVQDLFRDYDYHQMAMSPDGQWLASVFDHEPEKDLHLLGLGVIHVDTGKVRVLQRADDVTLLGMNWVGDTRIMTTQLNMRLQRSRYAFEVDGTGVKELISPSYWSVLGDTEMIHPHGPNPDEVLLAREKIGDRFEKKWAFGGETASPGVYRMNVKTGENSLVTLDPGWSNQWFADAQGRVRVAVGYDKAAFKADGRVKNKRQLPAAKIFWINDAGIGEEITAIAAGEREEFEPLGFEADNRRFLFVGRQGGDRAALFAYNPETRAVEGPLMANPRVDLSGAVVSPHDKTVAGIWSEDGEGRVEWLDPFFKTVQASVDAALPGRTHYFAGWSRDRKRFLILSAASDEPGIYYLLDLARGSLAEVYRRAAWLKGATLAKKRPVQVTARDGETLHGYLTLPPGATAGGKPRALVLLVHGGPWHIRDGAGFDSEVQFYATRGYAVLQVNFRGSGGYGRRFEDLARKQFAGTMQSDLDDAVDWAVKEGIADPARLIIAGASYGGYATLVGVATQPKKFRVGVAQFPVTDLVRQVKHYEITADLDLSAGYAAEWWKAWVGDPETEASMLNAKSPLNLLRRIEAPLFIVYGEDDPRISFDQSADLVRGLRALKKKFVRFAPPNERHGLYKSESRYKVYAELEKFLLANVPPN